MPSQHSQHRKSKAKKSKSSKTKNAHQRYGCPVDGCERVCRNASGLTQHFHSQHAGDIQDYYHHQPAPPSPALPYSPPSRSPSPVDFSLEMLRSPSPPLASPSPQDTTSRNSPDIGEDPTVGDAVNVGKLTRYFHKYLTGRKCDPDSNFLPPGSPPNSLTPNNVDDWHPFDSRLAFETANFMFRQVQMSATYIDILCQLWALSLIKHGDDPPFRDHTHVYDTIDASKLGEIPWCCYIVRLHSLEYAEVVFLPIAYVSGRLVNARRRRSLFPQSSCSTLGTEVSYNNIVFVFDTRD
ncbi:hypothetical protein CONPUDRAFT_154475 [Coniophora puteana RWD-64-598 SS2]|uniref:C2H2-type domain-containing protein n=1 Tax=Coniophora puteana (strain RWD-64-598) TaxID=741705 RepID=A0A5M3MNY2_CONPW|nr:uncharacterized protein CONPUDRAFT_154475 [Coniophora puteana RWD-64-598 SS2]EIW80445.1 hypothetical protein CONPUDRAFT_154475 [Coniophora puteana RWD-64-598 SS2]